MYPKLKDYIPKTQSILINKKTTQIFLYKNKQNKLNTFTLNKETTNNYTYNINIHYNINI